MSSVKELQGSSSVSTSPVSSGSAATAISSAGADAFKAVFGSVAGSDTGNGTDGGAFPDFDGFYSGQYGTGGSGVKPALADVRFGGVLTTTAMAATLIAYRASHDITPKPSASFGLGRYSSTILAIKTRGDVKQLGSTVSYRI